MTSGLLSGYNGHLRNLNYAWQDNSDASGGETRARVHFLVGSVILAFLSIFKKSQASSHFEALNSMCLSRCQRDMIPLVQMRRRTTAFSTVSTGDSDIPSFCEMKDGPECKPLQDIHPCLESGPLAVHST